LECELTLMVMSGIDDGTVRYYSLQQNEGILRDKIWILTLGRNEDNDIMLRQDTFISRYHAKLRLNNGQWQFEDLNSTNGSFQEDPADFFNDERINGTIALEVGQLFRVGRTWLKIGQTQE